MSFRAWLTIATFVLLGLVVWFGWSEIVHAWKLLDMVNLWILVLIIPIQLVSYYAVGHVIFSYLRSKGELKKTANWHMTRMALELNFVNHILPSGGAAGFSYMGWLLNKHGVSHGRAAMAQIIRYVLMFSSFVALLALALVLLTLDNQVNRITLLLSGVLGVVAVASMSFSIYILGSNKRLDQFAVWLSRTVSGFMSKISRGKKKDFLKKEVLDRFFGELHKDFVEIKHDIKLLKKPFGWSVMANVADVTLLGIAFLALGVWISPATLFVAFGVSGILSVFSVIPGGAGIYEAVMIAFLVASGVPAEVAIAGTILARVSLLLGTVVFGYVFYQLTIFKYGKKPV